jgi:hypothetical protein
MRMEVTLSGPEWIVVERRIWEFYDNAELLS